MLLKNLWRAGHNFVEGFQVARGQSVKQHCQLFKEIRCGAQLKMSIKLR